MREIHLAEELTLLLVLLRVLDQLIAGDTEMILVPRLLANPAELVLAVRVLAPEDLVHLLRDFEHHGEVALGATKHIYRYKDVGILTYRSRLLKPARPRFSS